MGRAIEKRDREISEKEIKCANEKERVREGEREKKKGKKEKKWGFECECIQKCLSERPRARAWMYVRVRVYV